jgi:hypothetical protein
MDLKKEDWGTWTVDVRAKSFQKKILDFNPTLADYFQEIWKEKC